MERAGGWTGWSERTAAVGAGRLAVGDRGEQPPDGVHRADRAGIIFGLGMALGAANFIAWMF